MSAAKFYNTIAAGRLDLEKYARTAGTQNERVLALFEHYPRHAFAPSQVRQCVFGGSVPITSVRRSINTLTADGKLEKLDELAPGPWGKPEHLWRLFHRTGGELIDQREMFNG